MSLIGKKANELTILDEYRKDNRTWCKVKCSCGKIFDTRKDSITSERTKSCGHLTQFKKTNITGKRFSRLVAIKEVGKNKEGRYLWECKCDCGNTTTVDVSALVSGGTKSCGCILIELLEQKKEEYQQITSKRHYKDNTYVPGLKRKLPSNNTSGYKGVYWDKTRGKWVAQITFKGEHILLGRYSEKKEAIRVRKQAEKNLFQPVIDKYK